MWRGNLPVSWTPLLRCLLLMSSIGAMFGAAQVSAPGYAGHAALFNDHILTLEPFNDMPAETLTFEAWLSTANVCSHGTVMSYAVRAPEGADSAAQAEAFNQFVLFDVNDLIACHGFGALRMSDDPFEGAPRFHEACGTFYEDQSKADFVDPSGAWHHLAVTFNAHLNGTFRVYKDSLLISEVQTGRSSRIPSGGAFVLGGEQDCYMGCTESDQAFYGLMDEVRLWSVERTQSQIMLAMRDHQLVESGDDSVGLVAYWKFDDPAEHSNVMYSALYEARDFSGNGNHLRVKSHPEARPASRTNTEMDEGILKDTYAMHFSNNYAICTESTWPSEDITVEFWAKTDRIDDPASMVYANTTASRTSWNHVVNDEATIISFASQSKGNGNVDDDDSMADASFMDDAFRVSKVLRDFSEVIPTSNSDALPVRTSGSLRVSINSNGRVTDPGDIRYDNWAMFDTEWRDDLWHHFAISWSYGGVTRVYMDGNETFASLVSSNGVIEFRDVHAGETETVVLAPGIFRSPNGSLALGFDQECFGGCFASNTGFDGALAEVRVWDTVMPENILRVNMHKSPRDLNAQPVFAQQSNNGEPQSSSSVTLNFGDYTNNLYAYYSFRFLGYDSGVGDNNYSPSFVPESGLYPGFAIGVMDLSAKDNNLILGSDSIIWKYSTAPLATDGIPVPGPQAGAAGHALALTDQQVLFLPKYDKFPSSALTVEFWMWSVDKCRQGTPFSYAAPGATYQHGDNAFLITNYNDFSIGVMEDEGPPYSSGVGVTDGQWHHIAVTWESTTGKTVLYDNGNVMWVVKRAKGKSIPSGGTLVIGREQDCEGGCFDSALSAVGQVSVGTQSEYGSQDFFGVIEEMRIWNDVRTREEILLGIRQDDGLEGNFLQPGVPSHSPNLVGYWKFDEGTGYLVKDVSGGCVSTSSCHHLMMAEEPSWIVVGWKAFCGNGIFESGAEECDDGNTVGGDGCSSNCHIEANWVCNTTLPYSSVCSRALVPPGQTIELNHWNGLQKPKISSQPESAQSPETQSSSGHSRAVDNAPPRSTESNPPIEHNGEADTVNGDEHPTTKPGDEPFAADVEKMNTSGANRAAEGGQQRQESDAASAKGESSSASKKGGMQGLIIFVVVTVMLLGLGCLTFVKWEELKSAFPVLVTVESKAQDGYESACDYLGIRRGYVPYRASSTDGYGNLELDNDDAFSTYVPPRDR